MGNFMRYFREKRGITKFMLAEKIGVSDDSIRRWENGHREPRASDIKKLCEVLGISEAELLNGPADNGEVKFSFVMDIREVESEMESMEVRMNEFKLGTGDNDIFGLFRVPKDTDGVYVTMWKRLDGSS